MKKKNRKNLEKKVSAQVNSDSLFVCDGCGTATSVKTYQNVLRSFRFSGGDLVFPLLSEHADSTESVSEVLGTLNMAGMSDDELRKVYSEKEIPYWKELIQEARKLYFVCAISLKNDLRGMQEIAAMVLHPPENESEHFNEARVQ